MAFAAVFAGWGLWHFNRYQSLLENLAARGVQVEGVVIEKSRSYPSGSSSASPSFVIEVEHRYEGRPYSNPYAVSRSQYEALAVSDRVGVTLLPDEPGLDHKSVQNPASPMVTLLPSPSNQTLSLKHRRPAQEMVGVMIKATSRAWRS
ncbi:hypothetical protein CKO31_05625 [Thiohalocapsa halophila]|uniref:DUF3592 domain-containing protein n=1 Tax=Thiohalocapsa halophila TaxID=69359 RepID=A0ABS1CE94_9GAMM|nr:hypothetical protein [Thiohalocapsa halophila]MBK1630232.1 hypothetical protein [Thiohalocapsa halophila]